MTSFFLAGALPQVQDSPTMRLHRLIDWARIENKLVGLYKREQTRGGGLEPYSPLGMFKLVLLGQWHRLSDAQLEETLRVRLDLLVFCEFDLGDALPDHTTICRFRNRLVAAKLDEKLLAEVNRQLEALGLKVNEARGAIIDTTFIRPANESETKQFKRLVRQLPHGVDGVLADKGFASQENRQYLKRRKLTDLVQHNGHHHKPLAPWQKAVNRLIGTVPYKVERAFGTLKRQFHMGRARYFGTDKVQTQVRWAAIGFNLLKAQRKVERLCMQSATAGAGGRRTGILALQAGEIARGARR